MASPNAAKKDLANLLASDPYICPQPFGLTNFQSKIIAPLFTTVWRLHEHEPRLLPRQFSQLDTLITRSVYEPPSHVVHETVEWKNAQIQGAFGVKDSDPELEIAMMASADHEGLTALASTTACTKEAREAYAKIGQEELSEFDGMVQRGAYLLANQPVTFIPTHKAGWVFERCLSVALFGRECLFPCMVKALTNSLTSGEDPMADRAFSSAYVSVFGTSAKKSGGLLGSLDADSARATLVSSIRDGGLLDQKMHALRACFVANFTGRAIIEVTSTSKNDEPFVTFCLPAKALETPRRPIVICQEHVVALPAAHPTFDHEPLLVTLSLPKQAEKIFLFPQDARLDAHFKAAYDEATQTIVLNAGGTQASAESHEPIALPPQVSCISPIREEVKKEEAKKEAPKSASAEHKDPQPAEDTADGAATTKKEEEPKASSLTTQGMPRVMDFSSFPATYFALSHVSLETAKPSSVAPTTSSASASAVPEPSLDNRQESTINDTPLDRDRAIAPLLHSPGFGKDEYAPTYLGDVLTAVHNAEPMHVDADGHCLLHAISRLLIGKEYLWHALRTALYRYMIDNAEQLKEALTKNDATAGIVAEYDMLARRADPKFKDPTMVVTSARGLGSEHIFALSNMLKRPIVLLDKGHESFVFLPLLHKPEDCATKRAIAVAWTAPSYHHFVPVMPKFDDACLEKKAIPMRQDDDSKPSIYACSDKEDPNDVMKRYLAIDEDGSVPLGGEVKMNVTHMAHYVLEEYRKSSKTSIWSLHELARMMVQGASAEAHNLGVIDDAEDFLAVCTEQVKMTQLYYCPGCTRTNSSRICITPSCLSDGRRLEVVSGRFDYRLYDSMPVRADPKFACCGWKHFYCTMLRETQPIPGEGEMVYARDLCNAYATAIVLGTEHSRTTGELLFHIEFLNGTRRMCTPVDDMLAGYPVDCNLRATQLAVRGFPFEVRLCLDADPRVATNPQNHAVEALAASRYRVRPEDRAMVLDKLTKLIETSLEDTKEQIYQAFIRKEEKNAPMRPDSKREPKYQDKDGNPVLWESEDPRSHEWIPYERVQTGTLEAAYQDGNSTCVVKIEGFGYFTCNFTTMTQENDMGGSRSIRQVKKLPFACLQCSFENQPDRDYCEMCVAPRPPSSVQVVRDKDSLAAERIEKSYTDDRLKRGGTLYDAARTVDSPRGSVTVNFPGAYGKKIDFCWHPELERYVIIKTVVLPGDPLYGILEARLNKETMQSQLLSDTLMQKHVDGSYTEVKKPSRNSGGQQGYMGGMSQSDILRQMMGL